MTVARGKLVDETITPWYHCISRCVRRMMLMGDGFEHRKRWLEKRLEMLSANTGVRCAGFAIMDNHLHLLLRLDSAATAAWTPREVARRWARLFPPRESKGQGPVNIEAWIAAHAEDARWVAMARGRLGSVSWYMKWLKEPLARMANKQDGVTGAFWEGRFRSIAILDDESLLATCAYIDLNPVAAGIAITPEESLHTSFHARVEHCRQAGELDGLKDGLSTETSQTEMERTHWLLPIEDRREQGEAVLGLLGGFTFSCYARLLDWTSRLLRTGKARVNPELASIFARLHIDAERWQSTLQSLLRPGKLVGQYFGRLQNLREMAARHGKRWVKNRGTRAAVLAV
jgi:REP element-mobilizing transposase RayT